MGMKRKFLISILCLLAVAVTAAAQDDNLKKYQAFDFSKQVIARPVLEQLELTDLQNLRGIVFGKRGRIFKEKSIQDYLKQQKWYKPNPNFDNKLLTASERKNIDLIRLAEAEKHDFVQPGDLRLWEDKPIPEDKIPFEGAVTRAEWDVLIAEFEAIHGKTFTGQDWLQKYFNERYWYKPDPNYSASVLSEIERKNLQAFIDAKNKLRKVSLSPGDMDKFQTVLLKEDQLAGLNLNELRIIRNEFWARRGKKFSTPGYKAFYEWQDWYKPVANQSKVKLNATEQANVKLIANYERKLRDKLTTEQISPEILEGLFAEDLRILRNEIFARHGYVFKDKKLQQEFVAMEWYKPDETFTQDKVATTLNTIEFKNLAAIKAAEDSAVSKFNAVEG
jgi:YARHG domain